MIAPLRYAEQQPSPTNLVEGHLSLVQRLAWHFYGRVSRYVEIDDLLQAGYVGLVGAAQRYTACDGVSFSAYAAIRVRGAIIDHLRSNSNLCRNTISMRKKVEQARRDLSQELGREPETLELAEKLKMPPEDLLDWENRFQVNQVQSLDEIYTDHSILFSDTQGTAEDDLERTQLKVILKESIGELPERSALVLQLYYVEELNVYEIAAILEVSTGRVSQIKKAAVEQLRDIIQARLAN
ncbi:FliA/WhiG family RNA polymerase sigma factor [Roseovarius gahaiensis]|uniref:FliA/WhiG family RNA polymerase sigma factor n=1 Tax=Roseovarius gahaiensis TaxID=2716691 RepID=A0A967BIQ0_9RHOB|nr:FliA/WhiG family RNA polymerase sigma factor [Roseovarius gahaiensis]NHQ75552.1 FliA/WhiG family RNA polymerase sigma factor [Roseovarius gahaiensis]